MKTPWKIISRLFSSGRTSQAADSRDETSDKVSTSTADVDAVAEPVQLELEAPAEKNTEDEPSDRASPTPEAAKATAERIGVVSEHASQKDQAARRKGRGNTPSKASVTGRASPASTHSALPQANKAKRPAAKPSNLRRTPASRNERPPQTKQQARSDEDVANLDAEIRALSRQLSAKLQEQNAQLRKMLERFGPI